MCFAVKGVQGALFGWREYHRGYHVLCLVTVVRHTLAEYGIIKGHI